MHRHRPRHLDRLGQRLGLEDEHVRPLGQPRVGRLRAEERRRLPLVGGARGERCRAAAAPGCRKRAQRLLIPAPPGGELADRAVEAADRRHRVGRVEREAAAAVRAGGGRLGRERAVARGGSRRSSTRARERPFLLVAPARRRGRACPAAVRRPLAAAHHEDADRRLAVGLSGGVVGEPAVEELELLVEVPPHAPARSAARSRRRGRSSRRRASRRGSTGPITSRCGVVFCAAIAAKYSASAAGNGSYQPVENVPGMSACRSK